jgi:hypothetical protein
MKIAKLIVCLALLAPSWLLAQEAKVTEVMSKDLSNIPGKEGLMITVEYPPGQFRSRTSPQFAWVYLCAGRLDRDAGEGWRGSYSDAWSDLL